jgi:hypothetical protein
MQKMKLLRRDHKAIIKRFRPWIERGEMFLLTDVPAARAAPVLQARARYRLSKLRRGL